MGVSRPRFRREYRYLVEVKTSRSSFIEKAASQYLAALAKSRREAQDSAILDARAESLNREALDVLEYQDLA